MVIRILIIASLCVFYGIYFAKMLLLKKQGISVDLLGKGDKPQKDARIEIALKLITYIGAVVQFGSALFPNLIWACPLPLPVRIVGVAIVVAGVILFAISVTAMRNNWRAGFDSNQNTTLVTSGIYKHSRNPAFVGFDLIYIGCALAFSNVAMVAVALTAVIAFHVQIMGEERFLTNKFGQEYMDYKNKVKRYL